jgi:hypothetical protein
MRLKQRIVHILVEEIVAHVKESSREIILLIHWAGGRHSEIGAEEERNWQAQSLHKPGRDRSDSTNGWPVSG